MRPFAFVLVVLIATGCAGEGNAAAPATPTGCTAGNTGGGNTFTWNDVAGETGYKVYTDRVLVATLDANVTIFEDHLVGNHVYCVEAFNQDGVSGSCCDVSEDQSVVPDAPGPCAASIDLVNAIRLNWTNVSNENGYSIYRDGGGQPFALVSQDSTSFIDSTLGTHFYCIRAYNYRGESPGCCVSGTGNLSSHGPSEPGPCAASTDLANAIRLTWTNVDGEDGYLIKRDGQALATVPKDTTSFLDGISGSHLYCVLAFNSDGQGPGCCSTGFASSAYMHARLSWDTCDPQVHDRSFAGPAVYTLLLSAMGSANTNIGHDSELRIRPAVPDAWRFDDNGCQTGARLDLQVAGLKSCPPMTGTNPLAITDYYIDSDGSVALRLADVYDDFTTMAGQRYILWKIGFDHTNSVVGPDADPATCDGAALPLNFTVVSQILLSTGAILIASMEPGDLPASWNGGQVRVQPVTWGKVKALYR